LADGLLKLAIVNAGYEMIVMDRAGCRMNNDISYLMEYSRHRQIVPVGLMTPMPAPGIFLAPNATLGNS